MKAKDGVHLKQKKSSSFFVLIKKKSFKFYKVNKCLQKQSNGKYSL